jgi:hypothetical protein
VYLSHKSGGLGFNFVIQQSATHNLFYDADRHCACMSHKKALALTVMLIALVAIIAGIGYVNNYADQAETRIPVSEETIIVPAKGYGHISMDLNKSGNYEFCIDLNGTLRADYVPQSLYQTWVNGSYKPPFSSEIGPNSGGSGQSIPAFMNTYPEPMYRIFWNTDASANVEVTVKISQVTTEQVYNNFNLGFGVFLITAGAVSGLVAAFWVSRRVLLVVIALTLAASGAILTLTYSKTFTFEEAAGTSTIAVPASGIVNEPIRYNATGYYMLMLKVDKGTMNSTVLSEQEFTVFQQQTETERVPYWQKWKNEASMGGSPLGGDSTYTVYLLLSNTEAYQKQVTIEIHRYWAEYNYIGLIGGILLIIAGVGTFYFANRHQIASFNRALENQEGTNISASIRILY